ncbi:MAG: outer membrane beta-barrel protein [bacterium]
MKRFTTIVAMLAVAGSAYGASLKQGTQEVVVEGLFDPDSAAGTVYDLSLGYGTFVQDNVEVGGQVNWSDDDVVTSYGAGAFAEYNFDQGTELVPYVGAAIDYVNSDIEDVDELDSFQVTGEVGVKYFLAENVAISVAGKYQWSDEDIYAEDGDLTDTNIEVDLGMRFFIP